MQNSDQYYKMCLIFLLICKWSFHRISTKSYFLKQIFESKIYVWMWQYFWTKVSFMSACPCNSGRCHFWSILSRMVQWQTFVLTVGENNWIVTLSFPECSNEEMFCSMQNLFFVFLNLIVTTENENQLISVVIGIRKRSAWMTYCIIVDQSTKS